MTPIRPRSIPMSSLASATLQLSHLTFDPLLRFRQDLTLEPRLATSWEKIDERTTRFHLREGVQFHSGRTLSAAGRGVDLQSAEAEPGLQGAVRAVQRGEGGRRSHRRPHHQGPVSAGAQSRDLHLPHGPRVLFRHRRARPAQGRHRQARRVLRLDPCLRHRAVHRHRARAGGEARIQALRRLLGQGLARQCRSASSSRRSRSPPRASRRCSPATWTSSRRCRRPISTGSRAIPAARSSPCLSTRILTFELNQSARRRLQGPARAARHQLRDQPARHRRQDPARLRHAGRRAQPAELCRLRSRARAALRSRQGQGADGRGRLRRRLLGDDDGAEQPLHRGSAHRRKPSPPCSPRSTSRSISRPCPRRNIGSASTSAPPTS